MKFEKGKNKIKKWSTENAKKKKWRWKKHLSLKKGK